MRTKKNNSKAGDASAALAPRPSPLAPEFLAPRPSPLSPASLVSRPSTLSPASLAPRPSPLSPAFDELRTTYEQKRAAIAGRLAEFEVLRREADDARLFEELVYCIFTAGASARMGLKAVEKIRPCLHEAGPEEMKQLLIGAHRFPNARSGYVIHTRRYLEDECGLRLRERLEAFGEDREARRDFFARNPGIKGIGYKEASHYLRNIGYRGYAILDKHILNTLHAYGIVDSPRPPGTKKNYLRIEEDMRKFAETIKIDFDELDLLLWSNKTGEILK